MARRLGATPEQIAALARADVTDFEPSWAVALRTAETMTTDHGEIAPSLYAELERHWSAAEIIEWSRAEMANFKVPRFVEFLDALPVNATGKVVKDELRERSVR